MAEIVNLRMARKRKARDAKEKTAEANRVLHGLAKAERTAARLDRERTIASLDAHRRDGQDPEGSA